MSSASASSSSAKRILQIGNWAPPVCSWSMNLVGLRKELEARGWDCRVMNLNENRKIKSREYIDVQNGWDYVVKVTRAVWQGCAVHIRVNAESVKGYFLAVIALSTARLMRRPALLTYGGGHQQSYFPAPPRSMRHLAFSLLFRLPARIYCDSEAVKKVLLTTGVPPERVVTNALFSNYYVQFTATPFPRDVEEFFRRHEAVFFSYICFRKEFSLEFLAEAIRRFRASSPSVGFLLLGPWEREMAPMREFLQREKIEDGVHALASVPHEMFLNMLHRSLAYIRTPMTDGVCASVLESLKLKVPVLAVDNGTRPAGTELWQEGNLDSLFNLMAQVARHREEFVARIPEIELEDNAKKLADSIEEVCLDSVTRPQLQSAPRTL